MYIGLLMLGSRATSDSAECFEGGKAIEKLISHKSLAINQIPAEFIKSGRRKFRSEIHKFLIPFGKEGIT
jgi:hypothetical protein